MKRILFVCSHLYSGSTVLCQSLNQNPRIESHTLSIYSHPINLIALSNQKHKCDNRAAIYMDELLYNYQLSIKHAYQSCKFIYLIREPRTVLNNLVVLRDMKKEFAIKYYTFRLRRIAEMAKRTPGAILLTWDNIKANQGMDLITEYLQLKEPVNINPDFLEKYEEDTAIDDVAGKFLFSEVDDNFQRYLYYLKNQNLLYCV